MEKLKPSTSRRDFLMQTGAITAGIMTLHPLANAAEEASVAIDASATHLLSEDDQLSTVAAKGFGALAIHQGLTLIDTTYINVLKSKKDNFTYEVVDSHNVKQLLIFLNSATQKDISWQLDQLKITELKLGETYTLRVYDTKNKIIDQRLFKTLDTNKANPKIAVASCMSDFFKSASSYMWEAVQKQGADLIFLVGDTCYADQGNDGTDAGYWNRYIKTRNQIVIFRQQVLTPILAMWDDHDFGANNSDGTFKKKQFTLDLFINFWLYPEHEIYKRGFGVYQVFEAFGQRFYLMDDRYNRDEVTQWGTEQEGLLFESLVQNNKPVWLMNGSQYFGGYQKQEAFEYKQGKRFKTICQQLSAIEAPVCFVSGDVHFSEIMEIEQNVLGYKTYELTSSSIHSFTYPGNAGSNNPRRLMASNKFNFMMISIDNTSAHFKFDVNCVNDEKSLFAKKIEIVR